MVNAQLAPIRAIMRAQGRTPKVKGVKQVQGLVETLDARDLRRLINVMARAGLRVNDALALKVSDVEWVARSRASFG